MNHIDEAKQQLKQNFQKVLKQKTIYKADILRLKKQAKVLADYESTFKSLLSKITTQANGMNGELCRERREKIEKLFNEYLN